MILKNLSVCGAVLLTSCMIPLNAAETLAEWSADKTPDKPMSQRHQTILDKINQLPMPLTAGTVEQSKFTVQAPHFWQIKIKNDIYHAAILFEDYPSGIYSSSMRFVSLFVVWKNGQPCFRQVIENNPEQINISSWELYQSYGDIALSLNYDLDPHLDDRFTKQLNKCSANLPVNGQLHADIKEFDSLVIDGLTVKNGEARAALLPVPDPEKGSFDEKANYRRKNPLYQIIYPHCYVIIQDGHTYHAALIDRQHEDLLTFCIWKDRKLHSVYLLDHYEQYYSTPDRMKIQTAPGATNYKTKPPRPVFESIYIKYAINATFYGNRFDDGNPSSSYYKYNRLTIYLKNPGIFDMRKQQFDRGFDCTPMPEEK
jgi:hypothetical protein